MPALVRILDPYAIALSLLVGLVGFGMNFFFNTDISTWGMNEIGYPAMAMVSTHDVRERLPSKRLPHRYPVQTISRCLNRYEVRSRLHVGMYAK